MSRINLIKINLRTTPEVELQNWGGIFKDKKNKGTEGKMSRKLTWNFQLGKLKPLPPLHSFSGFLVEKFEYSFPHQCLYFFQCYHAVILIPLQSIPTNFLPNSLSHIRGDSWTRIYDRQRPNSLSKSDSSLHSELKKNISSLIICLIAGA